jgi:uncharacterized protein YijF (DUF1287 family)
MMPLIAFTSPNLARLLCVVHPRPKTILQQTPGRRQNKARVRDDEGMKMAATSRGTLLLVLACAGAIGGLLPGQVNPSAPETLAKKRQELADAALAQIGVTTTYDSAYMRLAYPGGDVPEDRGVCTDVIIRALRRENVDLQKLLHEDKARAPEAYIHDGCSPALDASIDHRRVPNLMVFFKREGKQLPISVQPADYLPGDIVAWRLPSGLLHVGLVSDRVAPGTDRRLIVHNIGEGAQCQDILFAFTIIGHYRWFD